LGGPGSVVCRLGPKAKRRDREGFLKTGKTGERMAFLDFRLLSGFGWGVRPPEFQGVTQPQRPHLLRWRAQAQYCRAWVTHFQVLNNAKEVWKGIDLR
jgi:hypothetical protein